MNRTVFCLLVLLFLFILVLTFLWWKEQVQYPVDADVLYIKPEELQVGDMLMMTSASKRWRYGWWKHMALIIQEKDGTMCVADFSRNHLIVQPCGLYLQLDAKKTIYGIRRRRVPATPEQSRALTAAVHGHSHTHFNNLFIFRWLSGRLFSFTFDEGAENCTSFVIDCLQKAGLLSKHIRRHVATIYECARSKNPDYHKECFIVVEKSAP